MENYTMMVSKDPNNIEPYFIVWCSKDGTNTGAATDTGELQGATISAVTWTFEDTTSTGRLAEGTGSHNQNAVTINGVSYAVNTVCTIWLKDGIADTDYNLSCRITTSDSRTLDKTITIPVRSA